MFRCFRGRWLLAVSSFALLGLSSQANAQFLGTAEDYAVLAATTVTNTGPTVLNGDLGLWPGTSITGFGPGVVNGTIFDDDAEAMLAQADALTAYNDLVGDAPTQDLTGMDLGGLTLTPGVYFFSSSAQLTGTLTLDAQGDPNAIFIFQIGSTLTTASASKVNVINGGDDCNVYWQVGSSATLGTTTDFYGDILAETSITMTTGADIDMGGAFALNGAVTLDSNMITQCAQTSSVPAPSPVIAWSLGLLGLGPMRRRRKAQK
jgi:type VI secretion system secreted protein VgrG